MSNLKSIHGLMPGREHDTWRHESAMADIDAAYMAAHKKAAAALKRKFGGKATVGGDGWSSFVVTELEDGKRYYFTVSGNYIPKGDYYLTRFQIDSFRKGSDMEAERRLMALSKLVKSYGKVSRVKWNSNGITNLDVQVPMSKIAGLTRKLPSLFATLADRGRQVNAKVMAGESIIENVLYEAASYTTAADLMPAIERTIRKHFPKSSLRVSFQPGLKPSIQIVFAVAGGKDEVPSGIMQNDLSYTLVHLWGMNKEGNLEPTLRFDPSQGGSITVKPPEGSHLAFGSAKVGLRKKKGTPEQVLKHIDTYFTKLLKTLKANKGNLPARQADMLKSVRL